MESQRLKKCSAAALDMISNVFGNDIFQLLFYRIRNLSFDINHEFIGIIHAIYFLSFLYVWLSVSLLTLYEP
ncbi:hypothetical protein HanRHA438_Chr08g0362591 [Helianthus annuus]|nr:hypothetical protein HanRHA438_Chr08g0362591 [Helianthus annuus]